MRLFNTLCLEITARCNRRCTFCPVAYNTRPDERMDYNLFDKALEDLRQVNYRGRIELYIYNEPAKDMEYLLACITAARHRVPGSCLMIATNGDYLRGPQNIVPLFNAGLNQLLINCYSPGLYERRLPWLKALPANISQEKSVYAVLHPKVKTVQMLDKSNPEEFGTGVFRLINRAGNIPQFLPATSAPIKRMCVKPFRLLNINWQGQAMICCQDYHGQVNFGNIKDSSLIELWNHPVMNEYRRRLLKKDRTLPLCNKCDCHAGAYPGNVDKPSGPFATKQQIEAINKEPLNANLS